MKKLLILLLFSVTAFSQKTYEYFESSKLEESREIIIGLPPSYESNPTKKYPLLVLLDGAYLFDPFQGSLSYGAYWDDMPETIIVAISQNKSQERYKDCTFDTVDGIPVDKGAKFYEFIGVELIPYIEKKYRVAPFRMIAGHGVTAGFANFFLYKDYSIFNAYIALNAELAPEMEVRIPERFTALKQNLFYYQSSGDGDIKEIIEMATMLDANIKTANNPLINYKYDTFKESSHYSSVMYSIPNAMYQIYDGYKPISLTEYTTKIAPLEKGHVKYLTDRYDQINKTYGVKITVRINDYKAIETAILKNKNYEELEELSNIARKNYPKAMFADYELALMYEMQGDLKKAAKYYQKASQFESIGGLTKDFMFEKYDDIQMTLQNQNVKK